MVAKGAALNRNLAAVERFQPGACCGKTGTVECRIIYQNIATA